MTAAPSSRFGLACFGRLLLAPLLAALLGAAAAAPAGEAVLLASTAPGYAPGMVITARDRLLLPDGASATLLFRSGQMLRLRGPFDGVLETPLPVADKGAVTAIAELLRLQGVDTTVIGGTRSLGAGVRSRGPDTVLVDPQRSGTYCLQAADQVWIARPAEAGGPYGLRRKGSLRAIAFPADATRVAWPDDVPIEDGDRFELIDNGAPLAVLAFHTLDDAIASDAARIAAGVLAGCHEQFDAALRALGRVSVPPDLWLGSDRGRAPSYRGGEPVALTVQSDMDGFLYCVAAHEDGRTTPIFPADAVDGARLRASVPVTIPGRGAAGLHAGPKGVTQVRCWLADHDIAPELPHALLDPVAAPLPDRVAADLDSVFANVSGGSRLLRAALAIRVD